MPSGWQTWDYTYDEGHPHAVQTVDDGQSTVGNYQYDANGNMTCRTEDDVTYKQEYNTENRISSIIRLAGGDCATPGDYASKSRKGTMWDFAYDGDGVRVATLTTPYENGLPQTPSLTAYYFGGMYEVTGNDARKYYSFGGQTVAMHDPSAGSGQAGLQYFLSDHLGSIVAVTDASGTLISQQRYLPFGAVRADVGSISQTDYGYTGQRNLDSGIGLMDYKARFYSPYLNRFIQPDTIVPDPINPQSWNRYSYVYGNPLRYIDSTGHFADPVTATLVTISVILIVAYTAFLYTTPQMQALGRQAMVGIENAANMFPKPKLGGWEKHEKNIQAMEKQMATRFDDPNGSHNFNLKDFCRKNIEGCVTLVVTSILALGVVVYNSVACSANQEKCSYKREPGRLVIPTQTATPTQTIIPGINESIENLYPTPPPPSSINPSPTPNSTPSIGPIFRHPWRRVNNYVPY